MKVPTPISPEAIRFCAALRNGGIASNLLILALVASGYFAFSNEQSWQRVMFLFAVYFLLTPIFNLLMRRIGLWAYRGLFNILNDPKLKPARVEEEDCVIREMIDAPWWITAATVLMWISFGPAVLYAIERLTPGATHSFTDLAVSVSVCIPLVALSQLLRLEMTARPYIAAAQLGRISSLARLPMALTVRKRLFLSLGFTGPYTLTLFAVLTYFQLSGCKTIPEALTRFFSLQLFFIATTTLLSILLGLYLLKVVTQPIEQIRQALGRESQQIDTKLDRSSIYTAESATAGGGSSTADCSQRTGLSGALDEFGVVSQLISERNALESAKQEFFAVISHELRSPLMSIKAFLSMLSEGAYGALPEKVERKAQIAEQNAARLVRLINNILDAEKLQSGKFECFFAATDTASIVERAVRAVSDLAENEHVSVTFDGATKPESLNCDEERMVQVLVNFLSNAIKHADAKPVVVKARAIDGDLIELGVQDSGSGLTPEQQLQVFEKFKQLDHSGANGKGRSKGTGIGLPIAKALVEQHGGTIGVTSAPGEGCYFWARIPRQQTAKTAG